MLIVEPFLRRELFRHLPVERFERVGELREIRAQHGLFPQLELFRQSSVPGDLEICLASQAFDRAGVRARGSLVFATRVKPILRGLNLDLSGSHGVDRVTPTRDLRIRVEGDLGVARRRRPLRD